MEIIIEVDWSLAMCRLCERLIVLVWWSQSSLSVLVTITEIVTLEIALFSRARLHCDRRSRRGVPGSQDHLIVLRGVPTTNSPWRGSRAPLVGIPPHPL